MKEDLVSICIPAYNGADYITQCLESASNQTYPEIEIIVVDDCSTDATSSIVNAYALKDKRIQLIRNESNLGLVGNWNKCFTLSQGKWIKFLFQDDYLESNCIAEMMLHTTKGQFIVCERKFIYDADVSEYIRFVYGRHPTLGKILKIDSPAFIPSGEILKVVNRYLYMNFIGEPTSVMFNRSIIREIGIFSPLFRQLCDLEYWVRAASVYGIVYLPEQLAYFRVHNKSMSSLNREDAMHIADIVALEAGYLYKDIYSEFRSQLSYLQLFRLKLLLKVRIYELELLSVKSDKLNHQKKIINEAFPQTDIHINFVIKLIYQLMVFRRIILRKLHSYK